MEIGIVGLPLVGKTTLFNLLTGACAPTGPGSEPKVRRGSAPVPDSRLDFLASLYQPRKVTPARIDFKDIPGLDPRQGEKEARIRFLEEVRSADALCFVVRAFDHPDLPFYFGKMSPVEEFREILAELWLADYSLVEKRLERIREGKKKVRRDKEVEVQLLERCRELLEQEEFLQKLTLSPEEEPIFVNYGFLTVKPFILAVNVDERGLKEGYEGREELLREADARGIPLVEVAAQIEGEIAALPPEEQELFMADLGLPEPGIARLARAAYRSLGLISFFTVGEDEVRAWPIKEGTTARKAAGKVHSDIERGFIRAEVFNFEDLKRLGSPAKVREAGLLRLEGKDYRVKDGDIIYFRFKV
ncbi:GTP-binding protein YchF [Ammonifex degensii KC4]|uniref:GTP-binding protein YchF n=1 Tax=Ammonifex degensii (strain DSM 10501 / KC4) TaxID=429009 RepID=C9RBT8_AMMDK|nr:redox-regulated ATPase YchF [Ammonifex degensii]ACX51715.1 GTP-binding protein YchF [Ammonifex degensii KC4]